MTNQHSTTGEREVTLRDCPPGPFLFNGRLGFKTEYGAMETVGPVNVPGDQVRWTVGNGIDVYVMASGEVFWGGAKSKDERDKLLVTPIDAEDLTLSGPSRMAASSEGENVGRGRLGDGADMIGRRAAKDAMLSDRSDAERDEPWMVGHHTRHPWAASGDQPERLWILRFNDPDQAEMSWRGPDAEREAKEAYGRYSVAWTCTLLATVPMVEPMLAARPDAGREVEPVEALAAAIYNANPCGDQETDMDGRPTGPGYLIRWDQMDEYAPKEADQIREVARLISEGRLADFLADPTPQVAVPVSEEMVERAARAMDALMLGDTVTLARAAIQAALAVPDKGVQGDQGASGGLGQPGSGSPDGLPVGATAALADDTGPNTIEVGKPMPYFCPACQAIPRSGFCRLAGCPTAPPSTVRGE